MRDYPTEEELKVIEDWDQTKPFELVDYIRSLWWKPEWGFKVTGKRIKKLELSTGGWSGNEMIISALQQNGFFWSLYWVKSGRGGHYVFKIAPPKDSPKEETV